MHVTVPLSSGVHPTALVCGRNIEYLSTHSIYGMALNIKNEKTRKLARKLAGLTDDTITGAVTIAITERLERVKREREQDREAFVRDILAIGGRCAAKMGPGPSAEEIVEAMYGEFGEPV